MNLKREIIAQIRDLTREYHNAYGGNKPQSLNLRELANEDVKRFGNYITDSRRAQFKKIINSLSKEERVELLALVWLGRGDAGVTMKDWNLLIEHAKLEAGEGVAEYLISKAPLADYIDRGLQKMEQKKT